MKYFLVLFFLSINCIADVSGLSAPRFGSALNVPAFSKTKTSEVSFSRSFFENRLLLGIDPIFNVIEPMFDADFYKCLENQVDELNNFFTNNDLKNLNKPHRIHITVMEVSGDLVRTSCRPDMAVMSDNNYIIQSCYSRPFAGSKEVCRPLASSELSASIKRYLSDPTLKEKTFNSLKSKTETLVNLLSK